ncbi:hypothetical protein [Aurantimonas endophytica]|uniref:Uncharacterized protein n=1 Tax=Aurantimonas endophytica TaxID=1522175 RepID=A0A7W6MP76_9HYPH|nr:hypothetical protein [Aurantimonas endophytica]MBB4002643.1 hypothetical protein [Aurantimonas endophytica]MCO6403523.1 hypothetical protein [Aurantimonas endophytica]
MPVQPFYATGTATVTSGSATVTGTGTAWSIQVINGGIFSRNGVSIPIASIESNTSLTLAYPWPGTTSTGAYAIALNNAGVGSAIEANKRLAELVAAMAGVSPFAKTILNDPDAATVRASLGLNATLAFEVGSLVYGSAITKATAAACVPGGFYRVANAADQPIAGGAWQILTSLDFTKTYGSQIAVAEFGPNAGKVASRAMLAGVWQAWRNHLTTADAGAAGLAVLAAADAAAARGAVGATGVGGSLITSADAAAARTAIGATATGSSLLTAATAAAAKTALALNNVDNTTDANKPVSAAQAAADNLRVLKAGDTVSGPLNLSMLPTANWHFTSTTTVSVANGAGLNFPTGSGFAVVTDNNNGNTGTFIMGGGEIKLAGQSGTTFVNGGSPSLGFIGCGFVGGVYYLVNNRGGTVGLSAMIFKTRNSG